ncbi:MAG: hypothetical protein PVF45_13770 [Anaerolineae bacterium]
MNTIKVRLWGLPAHVAQMAAWLRAQGLDVVEESRDYRDRDGERVRRYLTVQVPGRDGEIATLMQANAPASLDDVDPP